MNQLRSVAFGLQPVLPTQRIPIPVIPGLGASQMTNMPHISNQHAAALAGPIQFGQSLNQPTLTERLITKADVAKFAEITGDDNDIHLKPAAAKAVLPKTPDDEVISHGLFAFWSNVSQALPPKVGLAGLKELVFSAPVFSGDETLGTHQPIQGTENAFSAQIHTNDPNQPVTYAQVLLGVPTTAGRIVQGIPINWVEKQKALRQAGQQLQTQAPLVPQVGMYAIQEVDVSPSNTRRFVQLMADDHPADADKINPSVARAVLTHAGSVPVSTVKKLTGIGTLYGGINELHFVAPIQGNAVRVVTSIDEIKPVKDKITQAVKFNVYTLNSHGYDQSGKLVMVSTDKMVLFQKTLDDRKAAATAKA